MDVLTISSAQGGARIALVRDGAVRTSETLAIAQGLAGALPASMARLLDAEDTPDLVAAVTGPGSFTGLRAGLSLAQGVALGFGIPLLGVTVAEALRRAANEMFDSRVLWVTLAARTGHVFITRDGLAESFAADSIPAAAGRIAVTGDAANVVAASLAARGADVKLLPYRAAEAADIAAIALARWRGELAPCPALPLYGEAPLARTAASGRGAPA